MSQSVALPAFRRQVGRAGGVSVVKAPLSGGQSRTPGWRSHERARLAFGLEAGRVGAGGSAWVRGKLCMAVGRRACPSRQLRRRSTSWSSSVSDYTSSTLAPSRWKQIDWRLCIGNVNLLKLGGRPARPLSTFAPAGRLLCSCRSVLLSPFDGTATETSVRKARPPEADRNRVGKELVKGQGSPCWPRLVGQEAAKAVRRGERSSAYTKGRARLAAGQSAS